MVTKLTKTYLSKKPEARSFFIGLFSLALLAMFFGADASKLSASGHLVFDQGEYWRAFTTSLLHADLTHLSHNAFFFAGLSALLYNYFGLFAFPVLSIFVGGFINMATLAFYPPQVTLVGVSGVIYFMASFWLTLYIFIERRQKLLVRFIHAIAVSLIFLFPQVFEQHTSYLAHGMGYLFGVPTGVIYYFLFRKKIRAKDEFMVIEKDPEEDVITLPENSFRLLTPEEEKPCEHASDFSQCPRH